MEGMKLLLVLSFLMLIPLPSEAGYPYFHLKKEDMEISQSVFNRYIKPQLRSIVREYFHILKKLEPSQEDLIELWVSTQKLNDLWVKWKQECPVKTEEFCKSTIKDMYQEARKLDLLTLDFQKNNLGFKIKSNEYFDNIIKLSTSLDNIHNMNYKVLHIIEEIMIIRSTPYQSEALKNERLTILLHNILVNSELILSSLLDKDFRPEFDLIWVSFIKKLDRQILFKDDKDFLTNHLGALNLAWNSFHMKISKSDIKLPKAQLQIVNIMHNRWNSVLKVFFRN